MGFKLEGGLHVSLAHMRRAMRELGYITDRQGAGPGVWQTLERAA